MPLQLNLGRVQPKKKTWVSGIDFEPLDFVEYGGSYYTCVTAHTSASNNAPGTGTQWEIIARGLQFEGTWQNQAYPPGAVVAYGGSAYTNTIAVPVSAGTPEVATSYWSAVANGTGTFQGDYNVANPYQAGDCVIYRGSFYRANQSIVVGESPTSTGSKWDTLAFGYNGPDVVDLAPGVSQAYETGDVIRFRNSLYIVKANLNSSTSNPQIDSSNYTLVVEAENHLGVWQAATTYYERDVVQYGNATWKCTAYAVSQSNPRIATGFWTKLTSGIAGRGAWSASAVDYFVGDVVNHNGAGFLCVLDHTSGDAQRPTNTSQSAWEKIVGGFQWEGDWVQAAYDVGSVVQYDQSAWVATRTILASETDNPSISSGFDRMVKGYPDTSAITFAIALG